VTDPTNDLDPDEKRVEELLLRSARLDVPDNEAKRHALDAGIAALRERRFVRRAAAATVGGLALAAAATFLLVSRSVPSNVPGQVSPERIRTTTPATPRTTPAPRPACPKLVVARGDAPLLDDWEQNDSVVAPLDGRGGNWVTYDDGTGKQSAPDKSPLFPSRLAGGRGASARALHLFGGKFTNWGVTFGAELANAACYDASAYAGIEFWAKGPAVLKVGFQMIDDQEVKYGGFCANAAVCYNSHRKLVELGKTWKRYSVRWEDVHQLYDAGPPLSFDTRRIRFLEFSIGPESTPFDVWLDDVSFLKR
jgi:hypothetical protein